MLTQTAADAKSFSTIFATKRFLSRVNTNMFAQIARKNILLLAVLTSKFSLLVALFMLGQVMRQLEVLSAHFTAVVPEVAVYFFMLCQTLLCWEGFAAEFTDVVPAICRIELFPVVVVQMVLYGKNG